MEASINSRKVSYKLQLGALLAFLALVMSYLWVPEFQVS